MNESIGHYFQAWPVKHLLHDLFHCLSLLLFSGENSKVLEVDGDVRRKEPGFVNDPDKCHLPTKNMWY